MGRPRSRNGGRRGPAAAKPVVLAAFRAARELGLSLDDVMRELAPPSKKA